MGSTPGKLIESVTVQPHQGTSALIKKGQYLRIVDLEGQQVADFITIKPGDPSEYQDMVYSNLDNESYQWQVGHQIISSKCNSMWTITDDPRGGHYTGGGACRKEALVHAFGEGEYGCVETIQKEYEKHGLNPDWFQQVSVLNVNMNVNYASDGGWTFQQPVSEAGDYLELRAEMDLLWMVSVCNWPEGVNGEKPTAMAFETYQAE